MQQNCNPRVRAAPGPCGTFKSIFPLSRILSPQVTALDSAQSRLWTRPGSQANSMGYTDLQRRAAFVSVESIESGWELSCEGFYGDAC